MSVGVTVGPAVVRAGSATFVATALLPNFVPGESDQSLSSL